MVVALDEDNDDNEDHDDAIDDDGGEWERRDFGAGPGLKFYCAGAPLFPAGGVPAAAMRFG